MDSNGQVSMPDSEVRVAVSKGPSKMAESVALVRVRESALPESERICYDPYAIRFVSPEMQALITRFPGQFRAEMEKHDRLMPGLANSLVARTRFFDEVVASAAGEGLEQLVILGAGFDTRPYRIEALRNVRVFEVDQPDMVRFKMEKIKEIFGSLPGHVAYVSADVGAAGLWEKMAGSGYDRTKKTIFVMEGLIYYLPSDGVDGLLAPIVGNSGSDSAILFDYGRVPERPLTAGDSNGLNFARQQGEPIKSAIREPIGTFLGHRGFNLIGNLDSADYKKIYFHGKNADRPVFDRTSFAYAAVM